MGSVMISMAAVAVTVAVAITPLSMRERWKICCQAFDAAASLYQNTHAEVASMLVQVCCARLLLSRSSSSSNGSGQRRCHVPSASPEERLRNGVEQGSHINISTPWDGTRRAQGNPEPGLAVPVPVLCYLREDDTYASFSRRVACCGDPLTAAGDSEDSSDKDEDERGETPAGAGSAAAAAGAVNAADSCLLPR